MRKILLMMVILAGLIGLRVQASELDEVRAFFNSYVNAANTYSTTIPDFYSPSAKIIREVVKPDGTLVDLDTDTATYIKQMKIGQTTAKVRNYKNTYRNVVIKPVDGGYKISAERQPTGETYWLKFYQIVKKQPNGKWIITEEMMQTKVQIFLKYAK